MNRSGCWFENYSDSFYIRSRSLHFSGCWEGNTHWSWYNGCGSLVFIVTY